MLAETGERPLWARWLQKAARLWNKALAAEESSLLRRATAASALPAAAPGAQPWARQSWAQQLASGPAAVGVHLHLADPRPVSMAAVRNGCLQHQLQLLQTAAGREGATKLRHYAESECGSCLDSSSLAEPAAYLAGVRERCRREALAQWRTGSHWGAEETGRWQKVPRELRLCPHCSGGTETVEHMAFQCPLYADLRLRFSDLFEPQPASLHAFLHQPAPRLASFAAACRREWQSATDALSKPPPPTINPTHAH